MSHLPGCHQGFPSCLPLPKEYILPFCSANHKAGSFHFVPLVAGFEQSARSGDILLVFWNVEKGL